MRKAELIKAIESGNVDVARALETNRDLANDPEVADAMFPSFSDNTTPSTTLSSFLGFPKSPKDKSTQMSGVDTWPS
jgi:hypothetical protein